MFTVVMAGCLVLGAMQPSAPGAGAAAPSAAAPTLSGPSSECAEAFLALLNAPTPERVGAFEARWASAHRTKQATPAERAERLAGIRARSGELTVLGSPVLADGVVTLEANSAAEGTLEFVFEMSRTEPGKLDGVLIQPVSDAARTPLTPEARGACVEGVAEKLRENYVFPDLGAAMADTISANAKAGVYDSITRGPALARRLTDDCRAVSKDLHLSISFQPHVPRAAQHTSTPAHDGRAENFAFRKVEVLPGGVGYLKFDGFMEGDEARRTVDSAMGFLANSQALIIDLRSNGGGDPDMVRYITSYLFNSRTHLNDMVDRNGKVVEEFWTLEQPPARGPRHDVPVYVLTSGRTFSGAEEFAYNLKNLKRATLVGETTGGGAHPVRGERASPLFMVGVPYMRARNPISGTNWEGTGVEPDVKAKAADALETAMGLIRSAR